MLEVNQLLIIIFLRIKYSILLSIVILGRNIRLVRKAISTIGKTYSRVRSKYLA
jgi:hypothetical protein